MKRTRIQPMTVHYVDGTSREVCCGPAALTALSNGAVGYEVNGDARPGVCCHAGAIRTAGLSDLHAEARDTDAVYEALRW
jgi:hypothetical protein